MPEVKIKGIHKVRKTLANGKRIEYHRIGRGAGAITFWQSDTGIEEGSDEYLQALTEAKEMAKPSHNLFRGVIIDYLDSRDFGVLAERTQRDIRYETYAENGVEARFGNAPIKAFENHKIRAIALKWRDEFDSDRVADARMGTLTKIVSWAYDRSLISEHYLKDIKKRYSVDRSGVIWPDETIELFLANTPEYVGRILLEATETGLRPGDLIRLGRAHVFKTEKGREIRIHTNKNGQLAVLPVTKRMSEIIDAAPEGNEPFLHNASGERWTNANSLGDVVSEWRDRLEIPEVVLSKKKGKVETTKLRLYDARGTAATRLLQAGASLSQIAACMGWSIQTADKTIRSYARVNGTQSDEILKLLEGREK